MPIIVIVIVVIVIILIISDRNKEKKKQSEREKNYQELLRKQKFEKRKQEIENQKYEQALNNAKIAYEEALNGKDKRDALNKGRIYYALLRNGYLAISTDYSTELSARDESRIRTDLQTMNV